MLYVFSSADAADAAALADAEMQTARAMAIILLKLFFMTYLLSCVRICFIIHHIRTEYK